MSAMEVRYRKSQNCKADLDDQGGTKSGRNLWPTDIDILLYDIRSSRPLLVKDHQMGLPVRKIEFVADHDLVLSMDSRVLKMWNEKDGKPFAAIEPGTGLADFCRYPDSGLLLFANEAPKMLQYFVPAIGTAPKWCSYLETITEELEETEQPAVYDDYKFVTSQQLEDVGLSHLIGTNILRAYMHGYFIDVRLYNKAKTFTQPFAYDNYKQRKLLEKMDDERANPSVIKKIEEKKVPKVNKELAAKLQAEISLLDERVDKRSKKKGKEASTVLADQRFASLFTNPDFEIDQESEQYKLINPALKKLEEKKKRLARKRNDQTSSGEDDEEYAVQSGLFMEEKPKEDSSSDSSSEDEELGQADSEESDEDEHEIDQAKGQEEDDESGKERRTKKQEMEGRKARKPKGFQLIELDVGEDASQFMTQSSDAQKGSSQTLGAMREQLSENVADAERTNAPFGGRQMTFRIKPRGAAAYAQRIAEKQEEHLKERKELHRGAREITRTLKRLPVRGGFRGRGRPHRH
ncbi:unnamed protein product [Toxocara canis]|uniref:NUC153 domain-containing protein n=1 Tax=Toxocara canis TaxID=6265 RepID=A0A183UTR8_TOXCA|nr:unnamed protein product [Toxocara canis]